MAMPEIDGALVGGASLDPDEFATIVQYRPLTAPGGAAVGSAAGAEPGGTVGTFRAR